MEELENARRLCAASWSWAGVTGQVRYDVGIDEVLGRG